MTPPTLADPLNRTATAETSTSFDPRGFTSSFDETETASDGTTKNKDLDYVYDASGRVISRTRGNGATRLYFYFAGSRQADRRDDGNGRQPRPLLRGLGESR